MPRNLEKGELECLVKRVLDAYVTDVLTPPEDKLMSAHRIARFVEADLAFGVDDVTAPMEPERAPKVVARGLSKWQPEGDHKKISPGAVFELLGRWRDVGFIEAGERPLRFVQYTEEATRVALPEMKAAKKRRRKIEAVSGITLPD